VQDLKGASKDAPFFIGSYFAYVVAVHVRSAICSTHGIPFTDVQPERRMRLKIDIGVKQ
jgi:hypothetical protein